MQREVERWVTIGGRRIPIFKKEITTGIDRKYKKQYKDLGYGKELVGYKADDVEINLDYGYHGFTRSGGWR